MAVQSGSATIVDSLFQNNQAGHNGGKAIYLYYSPVPPVTIINSNPSSQTDSIGGHPSLSKLLTCAAGTTTACGSSTAQTCTAATSPQLGVVCTYDNSCSAISIPNAVCNNCFNSACLGIGSCTNGKFDSDGIVSNDCESSFDCNAISVGGATCTACSDATTCTALSSCAANRGDLNGLASDGCEATNCPHFLYADNSALAATDGYNVLTASCIMGDQFSGDGNTGFDQVCGSYSHEKSIPSCKTLKIKKDPAVVDEVIIHRQATNNGDNDQKDRHFDVKGKLIIQGITLKGGYVSVSVSSISVVSYFNLLGLPLLLFNHQRKGHLLPTLTINLNW